MWREVAEEASLGVVVQGWLWVVEHSLLAHGAPMTSGPGSSANSLPPDKTIMRTVLRRLSNHPAANPLLVLLIPGISLKRWLALGGLGLIAVTLGIMFSLKISLGPSFHSFAGTLSLRDAPPIVRSGVFIGVGVLLFGSASLKFFGSLTGARSHRRDWPLLDSLYVDRVLGAGPRIVVIGGGSGLPNLLRGLKQYTSNLTAVVTVADDGGSSGRLRSELDILPPGDIRNCLVALADSEEVMQRLMDFRFSTNGQLDGHSFGNILIAALASIGGDFYRGVEIAGELLAIRGKVVPSTSSNVTLVGRTVSGQRLIGESRVGTANEQLRQVALFPDDAPAHPDAKRAIEEADLIVLGPGSLFTSIVPNLLVRDIAHAISGAKGLKMYVCNVAVDPGETAGFSVFDHVNAIRYYAGDQAVHIVIANNRIIQTHPPTAGHPVELVTPEASWNDEAVCILADVIDEEKPTRHDPSKLAKVIAGAYRDHRGKRRRLPPRWQGLPGLAQTIGGTSGTESSGAPHGSLQCR